LPLNITLPAPELALMMRLSAYAPVIAVGKPGEIVPPLGAARFYVSQELWQDTVKAIVPLCSLVVLATGHTEGLRWELEHLVQNCPPERLLLWPHVHICKWSAEKREAEWESFLRVCHGIFPEPLPQDINRVRFIAFAED